MRKFLLSLLILAAIGATPAFAQTCVQGAAGVTPTATLTFTAPTKNTDGTAISTPLTYSVYVGTTSGGEKLAASALTGSPITVTAGLAPAATYYFYVTVTDSKGVQSAPSNEVCKAFPASAPNTVTITIQ